MPHLRLFPCHIFYEKLKKISARFNKELLEEIKKIQSQDHRGKAWSATHYPFGYTSYASFDQLHEMSSTFQKLEDCIDGHVAAFARVQDWKLESPLKMNSCWVNVNGSHASHGLHLHPGSVVSGTYYVKVPPPGSSLKFEDPRLAMMMISPPRKEKARPENKNFFSIQARPGHLVLFDSFVRHEVPPHCKPGAERISISFNYSVR